MTEPWRDRSRRFPVGALALLLFVAGYGCAKDDTPPNIVLILGDDLGWPYAGFMGDPHAQTPSLDRLAAAGTVFSNAHVTSSSCLPSHRALLTGLHPERWTRTLEAVEAESGRDIPARREVVHLATLPRILGEHGYVSWEGGKMWEGTYDQAGFTAGLATSCCKRMQSTGEWMARKDWDATSCGPDGFPDVKCPSLAPLREFLDGVGEQPFFLWYAPQLPHGGKNVQPDYFRLYDGKSLTAKQQSYYANVTWLDAAVGELLAELEARGLNEDTLIVFLSDNGWDRDEVWVGERGKGSLYELGYRTPLVFVWPDRVPASVVRDDLVSSLDLFPTLLEYAGAAVPEGRTGNSLRRAIQSGRPFTREHIVGHYLGPQTGHFVRTREWRYIAFEDGREELYAIARDPYEKDDVAAQHATEIERFRAMVTDWTP